METEKILTAKKLTKAFGHGHTEVRAVDGIDLTIYKGEIVLVMGPSGSGKTTLLSMLGGLLRPSSGSILIDGSEITSMSERELPAIRSGKIGFIFQAFNLLEALTVEENVLFPAQLLPGGIASARERAEKLIKRLGLSSRKNSLPATLSGGEKQRVAIARALINRPKLILADEPTGNLDSKSGQEVLMILHEIARDEGCSVIVVTHDPRVEEISDRVLWLEDGTIRDRKNEKHSWVKDPVCGMRVDEWTSVFKSRLGDREYHFCSKRCFERFTENPENFQGHAFN